MVYWIHAGVAETLQAASRGTTASTKGRGPFELIYYEACLHKGNALAREKYLKSGMGKRYLKNRLKRFLSLTGADNWVPEIWREERLNERF